MTDDKDNRLLRCIVLLLLAGALVSTLAVPGKGEVHKRPTVLFLAAAPSCPPLPPYESVASLRAAYLTGDLRGKPWLWSNICGPHHVVKGVPYSYTVVLTNIGYRSYRDLELSVALNDPLVRSTPPSRGPGPPLAVWKLKKCRPGQVFRVSFTVAFKQHSDPIGSNFVVSASTRLPLRAANLGTYDVMFVRNGTTPTVEGGRLPAPLGSGHQRLSRGVHVLHLVSRENEPGGPAHLPRIAINLPRGWFNYDGWGMTTGERVPRMLVSFWDVDLVYEKPCRWKSKSLIDPGPRVDALASALAGRPLRNATRPKDTVLDGFRGKYLQWSVPRQIDFATCDEGTFESWTARGWASDRYQQGPGQVDKLWILNVGGTRLVLDVAYMPQTTQADRQALGRIVRSIRFLR